MELAHDQVALARGLALLAQGNQFRVRLQGRLALATLRFQPGQHFGFFRMFLPGCVDALEAGQLAIVVLGYVVQAGLGCRVFDLDIRILLARRVDQGDHFLVMRADGGIAPFSGAVEFTGQRVAIGGTGIAGHHDEIAFAQRLVGELQPVPGLVRHVVLGKRRRLAVLVHVHAIEGEVAGVARPGPVVDVATEFADAGGRRIRQAHVLDFQVAEQAIGVAAEEAVKAATETGLRFAFGHQLLVEVFQRTRAGQCIVTGRSHGGLGLCGHVLDVIQHEYTRIGSRADFVGQGGGIEAVLDQVVFGSRVQLDGAIGTVVVGDHQPLRRNEAGRASAQRDHGAHRVTGQVGQLLGGKLQACLLQRPGDFRQLLGHPHALARLGQADA